MQPSDCKTCERMASEPARRPYAEDLTGKRFGKLVVDSLVCVKPRHWRVICSCGNVAVIAGGNLTRKHGRQLSCGDCARRGNVPTFSEWKKQQPQPWPTHVPCSVCQFNLVRVVCSQCQHEALELEKEELKKARANHASTN